MRAKIGLLGGTFDPPHLGHLIIAQEALTALKLDEVWFIPVYTPPHKTRKYMASPEERLEMTKRAVIDNAQFHVSAIELERKGPSYTIDTVKALRAKRPEAQFHFIIGGDMAEQLHTWKDIEELKQMLTFTIAERPGFQAQVRDGDAFQYIEVPQLSISSTMIRQRQEMGRNLRYIVPDSVREFIEERELYG
ncbi:nicotinate-nucleotide adenylyltransferase [Bacillus piscicola]|uniref:nicotinate-nucleotide adenylyltransferase n=1 Tax=Bacillus piscicola TaxID=1632684 RepID=UPI001F0989A0|nr:nicotinate-nucleotide adenylyltransferase [Bacillus piscicola]